jgi:hypothetical protein
LIFFFWNYRLSPADTDTCHNGRIEGIGISVWRWRMGEVAACVRSLAAILTPVLVAVLAIMEWRTKLAWSKELSDIRKELVEAKDEQIKAVRERLEFAEQRASKALWDDTMNRMAELEGRVGELREERDAAKQTITEQSENIGRLQQLVDEVPGKDELASRDKKMGEILAGMQAQQNVLYGQLKDRETQLAEREQELEELKSMLAGSRDLNSLGGGRLVVFGPPGMGGSFSFDSDMGQKLLSLLKKDQGGLRARCRIVPAPVVSDSSGLVEEDPELLAIRERWNEVIDELKRGRCMTTAALLGEAIPLRVVGNTLVIGFRFSILRDKWEKTDHAQRLTAALESVFERSYETQCELVEEASS